jgi:transposase
MNESTLSVGTDVHQDTLRLYLLDKFSGQPVDTPFTVPNNRFGADQAISILQASLSRHGYSCLEVGEEATGLFWYHFYTALQKNPTLAPFLSNLVLFNPKLVAKFKEGLDLRQDKDDDRDARAVAERLRFGRLPTTYVPDPFWQGLRRLTRYRYRLARTLAQEKTRSLTYLFLKVSAWQQVKPFSDPLGATSALLLTEYTTQQLAQLPLVELTRLIAQRGRNHFDDPAATARKVRQALETSYPVDPELDEAVTFSLAVMYDHIRYLEKLLKRLDREIARRIQQVPNPLLTVPGLGPVISAGILAEIVDIARFPDQSDLAAYAGLTWKRTKSGSFEAEDTRLTKTGSPPLRYYFIQGAHAMSQHNLDYKAYYWRKYHESRKHKHKRALVLTGRKLVRLVHTLLAGDKPYAMPQTALKQDKEATTASVLA